MFINTYQKKFELKVFFSSCFSAILLVIIERQLFLSHMEWDCEIYLKNEASF